MSRCDYDTIFQRVSCVTLVAIAVTFTIILTNVFVDIDGLLNKKNTKVTRDTSNSVFENEHKQIKNKPSPNQIRPEVYKEDRNYEEYTEDIYRSKRSLETPNFLLHVKNPKMKSILTDRLATLLEELDEEESTSDGVKKEDDRGDEKEEAKAEQSRRKMKKEPRDAVQKKLETIMDVMKSNDHLRKDVLAKHELKNEEDMLHLAMHNILLQGIIGHMDLNDVFKKVHQLVRNFKEEMSSKESSRPRSNKKERLEAQKDMKSQRNPSFEENKFFEELTKCDKLQGDITESKAEDLKTTHQRGPKLLIKTIIDITSNKDQPNKIFLNSKESIKGIIKLIYNGKSVKFSRMEDDENAPIQKSKDKLVVAPEVRLSETSVKENPIDVDINDPLEILGKADRVPNKRSYFNQIIDSYLKKFPKSISDLLENQDSDKNSDKFETKRLKRQIKIRYEDGETSTSTPKVKVDDDDELYVEIETHFDSKGMKGMKKKKLIRNIIDKIQKAIHSDLDTLKNEKKKKHKHLQVKKRVQSPLDKNKALLLNKIMLPMESIVSRHSDPISKSVPLEKFAGKSGETWKKSYFGPSFLAASKSMNSAEMGEVDVDYNKIMATNGIPQRLQLPLNTEASDEMMNAKPYFDLGNLKFFIKNIDGTGLSIGFNQYTDEPPDPDTIKLFTGIENLIQTFNKNNNVENISENPKQKDVRSSDEQEHELSKRDTYSETKMGRQQQSVEEQESDYHSNEYKIIFDNNFLPYDTYQEIYEDNKKRVAVTMNKEQLNPNNFDISNTEHSRKSVETKILPALMDENIFYKKLKPSEILSLATLLDRKKRSLIVRKIKNIKSKQIKLNKYLNTNARGRKKIILNKKRNKRQIDKIRIIATDSMNKQRHSEENIFLIDDDNVLADRAIIKEIDTPYANENVEDKLPAEHYGMLPYVYDEAPYTTNVFDGRSRHNQLMSKYPHIFLEEIGRSREDIEPLILNKIEIKPKAIVENTRIQATPENKTMFVEKPVEKLEELVKAIEPKQNYRLTVKVFPKNISNINSGYKEIHTSINKSFNRGGLLYSSLVNVSEISKVTKLNGTSSEAVSLTPMSMIPKESNFVKRIQEQQSKMDLLLKQHKKRIDEQLEHLNRERSNLDTLSHTAINNIKNLDNIKTLDNIKALDNTKTLDNIKQAETTENPNSSLLHMNKDDVTKLLASALFNLQSQSKATTIQPTTRHTTTTTVTSTAKTTTTTVDPMKLNLLKKIQQNENVTNEILHQINKNTELLQNFLVKLTDKLMKNKEPSKETEERDNAKEKNNDVRRNLEFDGPPKFWKPFPPLPDTENPYHQQFDQTKNESHFAIPFVYAYQQPYPINNNKRNIPVASVVYHGHIHAKPFAKRPKSKENKPSKIPKLTDVNVNANDDGNRTNYFIDELENDYKGTSNQDDKSVNIIIAKNVTSLE